MRALFCFLACVIQIDIHKLYENNIENVAINDVLPPKEARHDAIAN